MSIQRQQISEISLHNFVDQFIRANKGSANFLLNARKMYKEKHELFAVSDKSFSDAFVRCAKDKGSSEQEFKGEQKYIAKNEQPYHLIEEENKPSLCCCFFSNKKTEKIEKIESLIHEETIASFCERHCGQNEPDWANRIKEMLQKKQAAGISDAEFEKKFLEKTAYLENAPAPASR